MIQARKKYGDDQVAQIITFNTMAAKAAIKDVGRAMDMPYGEVDRIAKLIPATIGITIEQALKDSPPLAQALFEDHSPPPPPKEEWAPRRDRGAGRPTKQDRRALQRLRGKDDE